MKKTIILLLALLFVCSLSTASFADYDSYKTKIKDGLWQMAASPTQLVDSVKEEYEESEFKPFGVIGGFLKGGIYTIKEFTLGTYHLLTFNMDENNFFTDPFKK